MAGIAQVILTDHELDTILAWADVYEAHFGLVEADSSNLTRKLAGIRRTLECGCEGGACDVPPAA